MRTIIVALTVLVACASWAVTPEDITAQQAVVKAEQATLDSLTSQSRADVLQLAVDADSTMTANTVRVMAYAPASGVRDSEYVCIDVLYSTWGAATQARWDLAINNYPLTASGVIGRYVVHRIHARRVLLAIRSFLKNHDVEV